MEGSVLSIYISPEAGESMQAVGRVNAIAGVGLQGDRYTGERAKGGRETIRHVTLIAAEDVVLANRELSEPFTLAETRRNIVTVGIPLVPLVGRVFTVGDVWLRGVEPCDPCGRPSKLAGKVGFKEAFIGRGGLRAEVLRDGIIACGEVVCHCRGHFATVAACDDYHVHGLNCGRLDDICLDCGFTNAEHPRA